jgi:hypothetical protein
MNGKPKRISGNLDTLPMRQHRQATVRPAPSSTRQDPIQIDHDFMLILRAGDLVSARAFPQRLEIFLLDLFPWSTLKATGTKPIQDILPPNPEGLRTLQQTGQNPHWWTPIQN